MLKAVARGEYNKGILAIVGVICLAIVQYVPATPSPTWGVIQSAATALAVILVPNAEKGVRPDVSQKQGTQPPASSLP